MVWFKRNSIFRSLLLYCKSRCNQLSVRGDKSISWSNRDNRYRKRNRFIIYYYLFVCVLPVNAEPEVHNSSNPIAAATGNVTNQAVQIQNNGAPSRQYMFPNNSCNGTTMTLTPFVMGNNTTPTDRHSRVTTANWGFQIGFAIPLDGGMTELCKSLAREHKDKMRLDYELTRAIKCSEIMKNGFMLRPGTRVSHMCSDVIPITAYEKGK
jgi:hypothetical protein